MICVIDSCQKPHNNKTGGKLCPMHYRRKKLYGDPLIRKVKHYDDELSKILDGIIFPEDYQDSCWGWSKRKHKFGYGKHYWCGKTGSPHRAIYKLLVDENIDGLDVDHLCRNPECCNPNHLEAVTSRENTLRGVSPPAVNSKKTVCKNGHNFNDTGFWRNGNNSRLCKQCARDRYNAWYAKKHKK